MSSSLNNLPPELGKHRILDTRATSEFVGLSVADLRRKQRSGDFPAPILIGSRKHGWRIGALIDWLESRSKPRAAALRPIKRSLDATSLSTGILETDL
jgi:predicted DNA-binding transcriptional regulator AlpA